ncbi:MAG TPA: GNAT family N-acetyltransferase [Candidatus Lachnoclostridium stercorigallinarum]|uniref:GNAT family N-acetyltransferase n=1 Tax=Candidatus Lachnoclostridium stercorigallinarum TaxID=2838634 RepID=A0A9D2K6G6_9FIRM|nr:GNAT family N-acetyltransferase [Candidatus Lachnoclostridium stercorigallinarum]
MREERTVVVDGVSRTVVISDEREALLAADAAGRASVALWDGSSGEFLPAMFAVEDLQDADEEFLERAVRRKLGLPWVICTTERLLIREFSEADREQIPKEECAGPGDEIFLDREKLRAYIRQQYGFCQYGIWAVIEKESGRLIGKLGFSPAEEGGSGLELGYHIFLPWRGMGYALEGCLAVLDWEEKELGLPVYARVKKDNRPSLGLAEKLGFFPEMEKNDILYLVRPQGAPGKVK